MTGCCSLRFRRPTPCPLAGTGPLGWLTGHPTLAELRPAGFLACAFPPACGHRPVSEIAPLTNLRLSSVGFPVSLFNGLVSGSVFPYAESIMGPDVFDR
jgi:hypothetical protein